MSLPIENPENALIDSLDDKRLADLFLPAIKAVLKAGGGADAILKRSEVMAALRLSLAAMNPSTEIAMKASTEILNRVQGKPVERRFSVYADVADLSEDQLDREIYAIAKRMNAKDVIETIAAPKPVVHPRVKKPKFQSPVVTPFLPDDGNKPKS